jgi:hypothetical protein
MKHGIILPHSKNYKLKTLIPIIEEHGDRITRIDDLDQLSDNYDFFLQNGMINISSSEEHKKYLLHSVDTKKPVLIRESPPLRMLPQWNTSWVKLVWNSIFMDEGIHPYTPSYDRWDYLSKKYKITIHDYKRRGPAILFNLQMPHDAALNRLSFNNIKYEEWCLQLLNLIRKKSDRPIIIRRHPLENSVETFLKKNLSISNIEYSQNRNFYEDLDRSWCMISYNSTSAVESVLYGTHTICLDSSAFAWEVSGNKLEDIEVDLEVNRSAWLKKIAFMQWEISELYDSDIWNLIKSCVWK